MAGSTPLQRVKRDPNGAKGWKMTERTDAATPAPSIEVRNAEWCDREQKRYDKICQMLDDGVYPGQVVSDVRLILRRSIWLINNQRKKLYKAWTFDHAEVGALHRCVQDVLGASPYNFDE